MTFDSEINRYELYAQVAPNSAYTFGYGFVHTDREVRPNSEFDLVVPIFLKKTYDYYEYVDVKRDNTIIPLNRQEVNPYFVELSFFDDVDRIGLQNGYQLTNSMVEFIRTRRSNVINMTDQQLREWFNNYGFYELPWNKGDSNETTLAEIETYGILLNTITGRAKLFNITINT
jgi:hypothetical protein